MVFCLAIAALCGCVTWVLVQPSPPVGVDIKGQNRVLADGASDADAPADAANAGDDETNDGSGDATNLVSLVETRGRTMGTTYSVLLFDPPANLDDDWRFAVDAELRRVNDEMSTYLKSSQISQFNRSRETDWFAVSPGFAANVQLALRVSRATEGRFDVTIGPLIDAWGFGSADPDQGRDGNPGPTDQQLEALRARCGYQHLQVRMDPPAIRKDVPDLELNLSALAKGHGVDRIMNLLRSMSIENAFVEIGGEVRAIGDKGGQSWKVGIERPPVDAQQRELQLALPIRDVAIATSGDYRNFFQSQGQRYSHFIDPQTGRPSTRSIASVSVAAGDCMTADAWATAFELVGVSRAMQLAREMQMDVFLIERAGENDGELVSPDDTANQVDSGTSPHFNISGTGGFLIQYQKSLRNAADGDDASVQGATMEAGSSDDVDEG